ncbi:hypothetical protein PTKIN_Ptkin13bG0121500 [Pterospermum kingtungense]
MLLRETIQKTKNFFHKTVENLKCFFFVGYQKLSKPALPAPFSCTGGSRKGHQKDRFHADWEVGLEEAKMRKKNAMTLKQQMKEEDECSSEICVNFADTSPVKSIKESEGKEEKKQVGSSQLSKGEEQYYYKRNGGGYALAQKMKELEMMDVGDMEHVLDVEEAIHYYSRLKSPVYLSIVDKFFMDMYSELSVPQATASSINSSKRRFGSIRL